MNAQLRKVLGIQESECGKLKKEVVVYLTPEQIGTGTGAHCGACFFFHRPKSECFLTTPPKCNAEHGVCACYLHGNLWASDKGGKAESTPQRLIPKTTVGYTEEGPTRCGTCEYYKHKGYERSTCEKVEGTVDEHGCCNKWEEC